MSDEGRKELTPGNWREVDKVFPLSLAITGEAHLATPEGYQTVVAEISGIELVEKVPIEVKRLFNVARGTMLYGYFYYPVFTLAAQELFRVANAAAALRCHELKLCNKRDTYDNKLTALHANGYISDDMAKRWAAGRHLRNSFSHPETQTIMSLGDAFMILRRTTELINGLYEDNLQSTPEVKPLPL